MSDLEHQDEDDAALAAEYVLGLLEADAAAAFEARLASEPELRALVAFWEAEFAPLAADLAPVSPPPALRARLLDEIAGARAAPKPPRRAWAWFGLPPLAAAAVAAYFVLVPVVQEPVFRPAFEASLASEDGSLRIAAAFAPQDNALRVARLAGGAPAGRVLELWVIAEGAEAPVSLGVIPEADESVLTLPADRAALIAGGVLAVSDEPPGGSPTGAPTGTVLAVGPFSEV